MKSTCAFILFVAIIVVGGFRRGQAQDPVQTPPATESQEPAPAPTPKPPKVFGVYTVTSSAEAGWRLFTVDGSLNKFRSDLNYQRGARLLSFDFLAHTDEANGKGFDTLRINAFGWGGDPSAYLRVGAEKNKWYRFDGTYRRFDYFNNLANFALNQHIQDSERKLGDFELTLLPQNNHIKFNLGYSLDQDHGTALTTYDYSRDEFAVFSPLRTSANEYRVGVDARILEIDLSFLQGLRYFKEDTTYVIPSISQGNNPNNLSVISALQRQLPTRGRIPFTRFSLHRLFARKLDFTGQFIYSSATTRFSLYETIAGADSSGNTVKSDQFTTSGTAKRPSGMGDVGVSYYATDKLTISETFRVNTFRINGSEVLSEALYRTRTTPFGTIDLPPLLTDFLAIRSTGYRQFQNTIEADYKFSPKFMGHLGYRFTDRRLIVGSFDEGIDPALQQEVSRNQTHSVFIGFKAAPVSIWKLYFDAEHGTADNVFTRVDNYDFTNFRVRSVVKPIRQLAINASIVTKNNNNPTMTTAPVPQSFGVDVRSRVATSSVEWTPIGRFLLGGGYTYTHIDSDAAVIFYLNNVRQSGRSLYFMRDNQVFVNCTTRLASRANLFVGYRISKDGGQGSRQPGSPAELLSSYPLRFQSPEARLTVKLLENVDWNAHWQYFDYQEKFLSNQNYRAHTGYLSLRFAF